MDFRHSEARSRAGPKRQWACVYYVINAESGGLRFQLSTSVGGDPVDIKGMGIGTHRISRSAEFNTISGLSSTGGEDVAAVTLDVANLMGDAILPFPLSGSSSVGPLSANYLLASLELGPAIQLQTDFKMTLDMIVDDISFRRAGTITYHVEPKLKTKVSAPFPGRVKYAALEAGVSIDRVGGLQLGPLVEGEHQFQLGEFAYYDGKPFSITSGDARTDS